MGSPEPMTPMAAAMQWVARIMAAAVMMVLPGLAGQWLDSKLGLGFLALAGFALGVFGAMAYLIALTKRDQPQSRASSTTQSRPAEDDLQDSR